jgi:hypothetical protein
MLGEVVVDDQHVATRLHEVLRDARRGIRSDIGEARGVVALRDDDDGVLHRAFLPQVGYCLRHGRCALTDGAIDADHVLAPLVKDRVHRDGSLSRLAVTKDQLTLASPDGNECIDGLETGLERNGDRCPIHDRCGGTFNG